MTSALEFELGSPGASKPRVRPSIRKEGLCALIGPLRIACLRLRGFLHSIKLRSNALEKGIEGVSRGLIAPVNDKKVSGCR
jgi:hypothetical protein